MRVPCLSIVMAVVLIGCGSSGGGGGSGGAAATGGQSGQGGHAGTGGSAGSPATGGSGTGGAMAATGGAGGTGQAGKGGATSATGGTGGAGSGGTGGVGSGGTAGMGSGGTAGMGSGGSGGGAGTGGGTGGAGNGGTSGGACAGPTGRVCDSDQWCDFADATCGALDQPGTCQSRQVSGALCAPAPVCGCDGKTYPSACSAHQAGTDTLATNACIPGNGGTGAPCAADTDCMSGFKCCTTGGSVAASIACRQVAAGSQCPALP